MNGRRRVVHGIAGARVVSGGKKKKAKTPAEIAAQTGRGMQERRQTHELEMQRRGAARARESAGAAARRQRQRLGYGLAGTAITAGAAMKRPPTGTAIERLISGEQARTARPMPSEAVRAGRLSPAEESYMKTRGVRVGTPQEMADRKRVQQEAERRKQETLTKPPPPRGGPIRAVIPPGLGADWAAYGRKVRVPGKAPTPGQKAPGKRQTLSEMLGAPTEAPGRFGGPTARYAAPSGWAPGRPVAGPTAPPLGGPEEERLFRGAEAIAARSGALPPEQQAQAELNARYGIGGVPPTPPLGAPAAGQPPMAGVVPPGAPPAVGPMVGRWGQDLAPPAATTRPWEPPVPPDWPSREAFDRWASQFGPGAVPTGIPGAGIPAAVGAMVPGAPQPSGTVRPDMVAEAQRVFRETTGQEAIGAIPPAAVAPVAAPAGPPQRAIAPQGSPTVEPVPLPAPAALPVSPMPPTGRIPGALPMAGVPGPPLPAPPSPAGPVPPTATQPGLVEYVGPGPGMVQTPEQARQYAAIMAGTPEEKARRLAEIGVAAVPEGPGAAGAFRRDIPIDIEGQQFQIPSAYQGLTSSQAAALDEARQRVVMGGQMTPQEANLANVNARLRAAGLPPIAQAPEVPQAAITEPTMTPLQLAGLSAQQMAARRGYLTERSAELAPPAPAPGVQPAGGELFGPEPEWQKTQRERQAELERLTVKEKRQVTGEEVPPPGTEAYNAQWAAAEGRWKSFTTEPGYMNLSMWSVITQSDKSQAIAAAQSLASQLKSDPQRQMAARYLRSTPWYTNLKQSLANSRGQGQAQTEANVDYGDAIESMINTVDGIAAGQSSPQQATPRPT